MFFFQIKFYKTTQYPIEISLFLNEKLHNNDHNDANFTIYLLINFGQNKILQ